MDQCMCDVDAVPDVTPGDERCCSARASRLKACACCRHHKLRCDCHVGKRIPKIVAKIKSDILPRLFAEIQ